MENKGTDEKLHTESNAMLEHWLEQYGDLYNFELNQDAQPTEWRRWETGAPMLRVEAAMNALKM